MENDIMKMLLSKGKGQGTCSRVKSTFYHLISSCCFLSNIAACVGLWACAAFWCACRGWQVLWRVGRCFVGGRGQEEGRVFGLDDCAEVVNVLLNPWEVMGSCVNAIRVFGEAVALQSAGDSYVRIRNFNVVGHYVVARDRIPLYWFARSFPTTTSASCVAAYELYRWYPKQFCRSACFEVVQNLSDVLSV